MFERRPMPLQNFVNTHHGDFVVEVPDKVIEGVAATVKHMLYEVLGVACAKTFFDYKPWFLQDIEESLRYAYIEGAWDRDCENVFVRARESSEATTRMVHAFLGAATRTKDTDTPADAALRMLGAHAGIDDQLVEQRIAESHEMTAERLRAGEVLP